MSLKQEHTSEIEKGNMYLYEISKAILNIRLDNNFSKAIELISESSKRYGSDNEQYKIVTTGMGKAGAAMRKFSSILCSLGFVSCYLHPGEASHGDLGILEEDDVLFIASTSGKTREVLETISLAKKLGVGKIIGITSHKDSPIRNEVDVCLDMGDINEIGEMGLAPTTSILVMSAICDCLAICSSENVGLTVEAYALTHHSGYIGEEAEMQQARTNI